MLVVPIFAQADKRPGNAIIVNMAYALGSMLKAAHAALHAATCAKEEAVS